MSGKDKETGKDSRTVRDQLAEAFRNTGLDATMWILKERVPVEVDFAEGIAWQVEHPDGCRVAADDVNGTRVSTVFISMMNFLNSNMPLTTRRYFETMVFRDESAVVADRYDTWDEAEKGHAMVVERLREEPVSRIGKRPRP